MAENQKNIGPKRLVVGAHYGTTGWLAQRITAIVMAVYTIVLLVMFLTAGSFTYESWTGIFAAQWFKLFSFVIVLALCYHAWVGIRNIWMDYIKPAFLRLILEAATIVWLVGCAGWAVQILWRM